MIPSTLEDCSRTLGYPLLHLGLALPESQSYQALLQCYLVLFSRPFCCFLIRCDKRHLLELALNMSKLWKIGRIYWFILKTLKVRYLIVNLCLMSHAKIFFSGLLSFFKNVFHKNVWPFCQLTAKAKFSFLFFLFYKVLGKTNSVDTLSIWKQYKILHFFSIHLLLIPTFKKKSFW